MRERERDIETVSETKRDRDREGDSEGDKERQTETDRDRQRDRQRQTETKRLLYCVKYVVEHITLKHQETYFEVKNLLNRQDTVMFIPELISPTRIVLSSPNSPLNS